MLTFHLPHVWLYSYNNTRLITLIIIINYYCIAITVDKCAVTAEEQSIRLECPTGQRISSIQFASFGTPNVATCGSYYASSCHQPASLSVISNLCLGNQSCSPLYVSNQNAHDWLYFFNYNIIRAVRATFGADPCVDILKWLAVTYRCGISSILMFFTYPNYY